MLLRVDQGGWEGFRLYIVEAWWENVRQSWALLD